EMQTFTAVVTAHGSPFYLRRMLGNLRYQTRKPDEVLVFVSDMDDIMRLREEFPDVQFYVERNRNDWGHEKRSKGVEAAFSDYLGFFNADDTYALSYVERMME